MSCQDVLQCLAEGQPLSQTAKAHLESCAICQTLLSALEQPAIPVPRERVQVIAGRLTKSLTAVRPLPSDRILASIFLVFFVAFCVLAAFIEGFSGFDRLYLDQRLIYYGVLTGLAFLFSIATVQEMIPGSRKLIDANSLIASSLLLLIILPFVLFHRVSFVQFVALGIPCFRLGSWCALAFGVLGSMLVRNGYLVSPLKTSIVVGFLAGLAGFSVLALYCPIQDAAHIIVWHLGALLAAGVGGALVGALVQKRRLTAGSEELR